MTIEEIFNLEPGTGGLHNLLDLHTAFIDKQGRFSLQKVNNFHFLMYIQHLYLGGLCYVNNHVHTFSSRKRTDF